jgi:hypothetical protein
MLKDKIFPPQPRALRTQEAYLKHDNPMGTGILGIIGIICVATFGVVFRFALEALDKLNYHKAARWFFFSFLPLGLIAILWAIHGDATMVEKNILLGLIGAIIGASGFIYGGYALGDANRSQPNEAVATIPLKQQVSQNINSYGQQGGITAGIVNIGPGRLAFSSALGSELLAKMPIKKKVDITSVGGAADQAVAIDIQNFLQQNGYDVSRKSTAILVPPPDHKISLGDSPNGYVLTIAPSAN